MKRVVIPPTTRTAGALPADAPGTTAGQGAPLGGTAWIPDLRPGTGRYQLRFARTEGDLEAVCRLRFQVFNIELGEGLPESFETGLDRDRFDDQCQHLMVVDTRTGEVVGTYRMQVAESARAGHGFYSATEYDLSTLPPAAVQKSVELGRACVAKDHRSKSVLFMLWRGTVTYVLANKRPLLFGCSSITSQDTSLGLRAYRELERLGAVHPTIRVEPLPEYRCDAGPASATPDSGPFDFPTLFSLYLRYGSKVIGPPAIDRTFGTIDFLMMFDAEAVSPKTLASILR